MATRGGGSGPYRAFVRPVGGASCRGLARSHQDPSFRGEGEVTQVRVLFTASAERQMDTLHRYIADRAGEHTADRYIDRIIAFCGGLSTFPLRGSKRDDLLPGL